MRLLNVWCFPLPRSSAWLSRDLISRWSSLTFILCSGCLSFIFHWSIFEQGGLWRVGFVWPVVRQSLHTRPGMLASVMYSFSSWLSFCSSSFAVATCTFKTVTLNLISCCFESKGLRPCWAFRADVGLADALQWNVLTEKLMHDTTVVWVPNNEVRRRYFPSQSGTRLILRGHGESVFF